ncbi:MAG: CPBP family glutamic-type intramembrane protease [Dehalococcoidia bacterium]|nr:CPBP family glutamic-type intramembrane protease [Dehalococcoidia bacterium]
MDEVIQVRVPGGVHASLCYDGMDMERPFINPQAEAVEHLKRATAYREQNDLANALLECDQAARLAPDWADAHYLRGFLLEAAGRNEEAKAAFQQAAPLDSSSQQPPDKPGTPSRILNEWQVPWSNGDAWWGLGMGIALTIIIPLVIAIAFVGFSEDNEINGTFLSIVLPIGTLLWLVPVWWFAMHQRKATLPDIGFRRFEGSTLGIGCGMLFACYILMAVYSAIITSVFNVEMQPDMDPLSEDLALPWMLPLTAVLLAPLAEEIFFRGFLFAGLRQRYGWLKAALFSSAIFAAMHLEPYALPPLFLLGFLFAYLYHRGRSIWIPISMHFIVNSIAMIGEFALKSD